MQLDFSLKLKGLRQLAARADDPVAKAAILKEMARIEKTLEVETRYDLIVAELDLLDAISYRVPDQAFKTFNELLERLNTLKLTHPEILGYSAEELSEFQNNNRLAVKCLEALTNIRYHLTAQILDLFFRYSNHRNELIARQAIQGIEALAKFDRYIFYSDDKGRGGLAWQPQEKVLEKIESFDEGALRNFFSAILAACNKILSPTIDGSEWNYKSVTFHSGPIPARPEIKRVRERALKALEKLYDLAHTIEEKKAIINTLDSATHLPHMGDYSDDLQKMVSENTIAVLKFLKAKATDENLQITQKIEHDTYYLMRHSRDPEVALHALEVKAVIDNNEEYQVFKVLIGFEGIFREWKAGNSETNFDDFDSARDFRDKKTYELAESIDEANFEVWRRRILNYATIQSNDLATFPNFGKFLERFGETSPLLALKLLSENADELGGFKVALLYGLWTTDQKENTRNLISNWVNADTHLLIVARLFQFTPDLDEEVLQRTLAKAIEKVDYNTLSQIISTTASHFKKDSDYLLNKFFLPAVNAMTVGKQVQWIFGFWFRREGRDIIEAMNPEQHQQILDNLYWLDKIDHEAEEILAKIANFSPQLVIRFFCNRLEREKAEGRSRFDAVPFSFHELSKPLSKIADSAVDIVFETFDGNYGMFIHRGAKLLQNIFPNFSKEFENKLIRLVRDGEENKHRFVMAILRNYEGQVFLHSVCKELVKALPSGSRLRNEIYFILHSTGVVSGEYGFVEAYKRKILEVTPWLEDKNENIRAFAKDYISNLEKEIQIEKKRADEDIILRKYQYGESD